MRKIILLVLLILCLGANICFAELRAVAISCKAVIKEDNVGSTIITEFKYSLHTGIESEEVKDVSLKDLLPKIEKVAWAGSAIYVGIYSDHTLDTQSLKLIVDAIGNNPAMQIIYVENGKESNWGERIKKYYNLSDIKERFK